MNRQLYHNSEDIIQLTWQSTPYIQPCVIDSLVFSS